MCPDNADCVIVIVMTKHASSGEYTLVSCVATITTTITITITITIIATTATSSILRCVQAMLNMQGKATCRECASVCYIYIYKIILYILGIQFDLNMTYLLVTIPVTIPYNFSLFLPLSVSSCLPLLPPSSPPPQALPTKRRSSAYSPCLPGFSYSR